MDRRGLALLGAGAVVLALAARMGSLHASYRIGPPSVLLRVGAGYAILGALTVTLRPTTVRAAVSVAVAATVAIFLVGIGVMYYDLGAHPPEHGTPLTLPRLVATQTAALFAVVSVPAGYVSGRVRRERTTTAATTVLLTGAGVGFAGGTTVLALQGAAPGFRELLFAGAVLTTTVFALLPLGVMGWLAPEQ